MKPCGCPEYNDYLVRKKKILGIPYKATDTEGALAAQALAYILHKFLRHKHISNVCYAAGFKSVFTVPNAGVVAITPSGHIYGWGSNTAPTGKPPKPHKAKP